MYRNKTAAASAFAESESGHSCARATTSFHIIHREDGKTRLIMENGIRLHNEAEKQVVYDEDFVRHSSHATVPEEVVIRIRHNSEFSKEPPNTKYIIIFSDKSISL